MGGQGINKKFFLRSLIILGVIGVSFFSFFNFRKSYASGVVAVRDGGGVTNNRSDPLNRSGDQIPGSSETAFFNTSSTKDVHIDTNINVYGIIIETGYNGTITQDSGINITAGYDGIVQYDGTFEGGNGTITINSALVLNGGVFNAPSGYLHLISDVSTFNSFIYYNDGVFDANGGTIEFSNSYFGNIVELHKSLELNNVIINDGNGRRFTINNNGYDFVVDGTLTLLDGYLVGNSLITAKGNILIGSGFGFYNGGGDGIISTSGTVTITEESGAWAPAIELNTGATMNVNGNASMNLLILNGGTFNAPSGIMKFISNYTQNSKSLIYYNGQFNTNNGTVEFNAGYAQSIIDLYNSIDFYNVIVNAGNSRRFTINNNGYDLNVNGTLTLKDGLFEYNSLINAKGNVLIKSSYGNTVNGGGNGTIITSGTVSVTQESGSWAPTIQLNTGATMNVNGDASISELILSGGTFNAPDGTMEFWGPSKSIVYNAGIFNAGIGTIEFMEMPYYNVVELHKSLEFNNVIINPRWGFTISNNGYDFIVNGTLICTGYYGTITAGSLITAKSDVIVKSTCGGGQGKINVDAGNEVTIETGATTPVFVGSASSNASFTIYGGNIYFGSNDIGLNLLRILGTATLHSNQIPTYRNLDVAVYDHPTTPTLDYVTLNYHNIAPIATGATFTTDENTLLTIATASGVLSNGQANDPNSDSMTAILKSIPIHGTLTLNTSDGSFTYEPDMYFNGTDYFTYYLSDGTATGNITTGTIIVNAAAPVLSDIVDIPDTSDTNQVINEFEIKGYEDASGAVSTVPVGTYVGTRRINLGYRTDGRIDVPFVLQSSGIEQKIEMRALAGGLVIEKANGEGFTGILNNPIQKSTTIATQAGLSNILSVVEFGNNQNEPLYFKDTLGNAKNVQFRIPVPGANVGDMVKIYYSHDGSDRSSFVVANVLNVGGQSYAFVSVDHATIFAIGAGTGSFVINNDAASTIYDIVTLNIDAPGAVQMRFSNTGASGPRSAWESYSTTTTWTLSPGHGTKTVYAQFDTNGDNNADAYTNDSIDYTSQFILSGGCGGSFGEGEGCLILEIVQGTGSCQYGTSLDLGSQVAGYAAKVFSGSFGASFWCEDKNGTIGSRTLTMQASTLTNSTNALYTIPAASIEMENSPSYVTDGACSFYTGTTSRSSIDSPQTILGKNNDVGAICKVQADTVSIKVTTATNQAVGVYTGTLTIDVPSFN